MTARPVSEVTERIDEPMAGILRSASELSRVQAGFRMWTAARAIVRASILADHDDWPSDRVDRELAVRMSGGMVARVAN